MAKTRATRRSARPKTKQARKAGREERARQAIVAKAYREVLEEQVKEDGCSGDCEGQGIGVELTWDPCPDPCDEVVMSKARRAAKKEARRSAIKVCQDKGDENCLCTGGTYTKIREKCETKREDVDDPSSRQYCVYSARWKYKGTCSTVA